MGAQIPVIAEKPLAVCGCRKFQVDALGDHLCTFYTFVHPPEKSRRGHQITPAEPISEI
jgi:hypothetical protein